MSPETLPISTKRIQSIDILRGIIIVIMALDHVRDYYSPYPFPPEDLTQTFPLLFFTRWITHFCAPNFVFLAGTAAFLYGAKVNSRAKLSQFLLTRGIWLILVEVLIMNITMTAQLPTQTGVIFLIIIWVIGVSMIILAGFVWLPRWAIAIFAFGSIFLHNAFDGAGGVVWNFLHTPNFIPISTKPAFSILSGYPIIPWSGVLAAGYLFGQVMQWEVLRRRKFLLWTGLGLIFLFITLRTFNIYGNPAPWSPQPRGAIYSVLSFLNTLKYPPSLLFLCMTIGPALLLLIPLENWRGKVAAFFLTFGRVPFFFYIVHFPIINAMALLFNYVRFGKVVNFFGMSPDQYPADYQPNLGITYIAWILIIIIMYFLCRWYGRYKASHDYWWLKYI